MDDLHKIILCNEVVDGIAVAWFFFGCLLTLVIVDVNHGFHVKTSIVSIIIFLFFLCMFFILGMLHLMNIDFHEYIDRTNSGIFMEKLCYLASSMVLLSFFMKIVDFFSFDGVFQKVHSNMLLSLGLWAIIVFFLIACPHSFHRNCHAWRKKKYDV